MQGQKAARGKGFWEGLAEIMKSQYFGDNKDLFTYDLILQIMQAGLVDHFTFIPMLTSNDGTKHGEKYSRDKAKAGAQNKELMIFLDECIRQNNRNINQLKNFFKNRSIDIRIFEKEFSHEHRQKYFEQVRNELLPKSLIFADPDIGLEIKRSREKHLLYAEAKDLYEHMDKNSILMTYQYLPRKPRQQYLNARCTELKEKVSGDFPVRIDDGEIAFFFLTRDESLEHSLMHVIGDYAECYSK